MRQEIKAATHSKEVAPAQEFTDQLLKSYEYGKALLTGSTDHLSPVTSKEGADQLYLVGTLGVAAGKANEVFTEIVLPGLWDYMSGLVSRQKSTLDPEGRQDAALRAKLLNAPELNPEFKGIVLVQEAIEKRSSSLTEVEEKRLSSLTEALTMFQEAFKLLKDADYIYACHIKRQLALFSTDTSEARIQFAREAVSYADKAAEEAVRAGIPGNTLAIRLLFPKVLGTTNGYQTVWHQGAGTRATLAYLLYDEYVAQNANPPVDVTNEIRVLDERAMSYSGTLMTVGIPGFQRFLRKKEDPKVNVEDEITLAREALNEIDRPGSGRGESDSMYANAVLSYWLKKQVDAGQLALVDEVRSTYDKAHTLSRQVKGILKEFDTFMADFNP